MTWREQVIKELFAGFAADKRVINMVLIYEAEQTQVLSLAMPTQESQRAALEAARHTVFENRGHIEQVALVANTVADPDKVPRPAVMVLFESRRDTVIRLFYVDKDKLTEVESEDTTVWLSLGLYEKAVDLGAMYG